MVIGSMTGTLLLSNIFLMAAVHNYPGGEALEHFLHYHVRPELQFSEKGISEPIFVHIDTLAATTGVTRSVPLFQLFPVNL